MHGLNKDSSTLINISPEEKKAALFVASLASFLTPFMAATVNIALPTIGYELEMDSISLSWVATAYLLSAAIFLIPFGKVADIYGRKKIFTYGIIIYTIVSLLLGFAFSSWQLIGLRFLQGVGGAMIFGTGVAILTSVYPAHERGKAFGINVAAVYLGLSLGPFFGGLLTEYLGWRSIFFVNTFLGSIIIASVFFKLKGEWAEAKGEKFDILGSVLFSIGLTFLLYGFSKLPNTLGLLITISGIVFLSLFVFLEMRIPNPILDIKLFRFNKVFAFSNLAALINYSSTFAVTFFLSLYLQYVLGFSPNIAGFILVAQPIVMAIFSPAAGRISDIVEPQVVASVGMALNVVGLVLLVFVTSTTPVWYIILTLFIIGVGIALFSSPNTNAVMSSVEKRFYGVASATVGTMRVTGQVLSMGIAMLVFAMYMGGEKINLKLSVQFVDSMSAAFIIFSVLCFTGIFASLARGKVR